MTEPHDVEWTPEKVEAFWDDYSRRKPDEMYFSGLLAPALAAWIAKHGGISRYKPVLDLGCGGGHLLTELVKRRYKPIGVDSSLTSLRATAERIGERNVRRGSVTRIPLDSGSVGGVLLIETIEHVLDDDLAPMMREIRRVLGLGWPLVITTPNNEDIEAAKLTCPECACRFHPVQHVRSWTASSLRAFLNEHGFSRVKTYELNLPAGRGPIVLARRLLYHFRGDKPLLFAVARI